MRTRLLCLLACIALTGCGSGSSAPKTPSIQAARTFRLAEFQPVAKVQPGKPTVVSFAIEQPDGKPLTDYKRGPGPHTGVHLIVVSDDLSTIVHRHPPVGADGRLRQSIVLPRPGKYRVVIERIPDATIKGPPLPARYGSADTSTLVIEVKSGKNEVNFELTK